MNQINFSHLCASYEALEMRASGESLALERTTLLMNGVTILPEQVVTLWEAHIAREVLNRARGVKLRVLSRLDYVDSRWVPHFIEVNRRSLEAEYA
jgi:hypothetical protein